MGSIHSQGINSASASLMQSRQHLINTEQQPAAKAEKPAVLRSQPTVEVEPAVIAKLSSNTAIQASDGNRESHTYSHLDKTLTAEQLKSSDIRGSLNSLQGVFGAVQSFTGTSRQHHEGLQGELPPRSKTTADSEDYHASEQGTLFTLTVTTSDGDKIELEINKSQGAEGSLSDGNYYSYSDTTINYKVDGELDAEEIQALADLIDKLGGMSDNYRSDGWLTLGDTEAFNSSELRGFKLDILGEGADSFSLQYSIDSSNGQRSLSSDLNGYTFDVKVDVNGFKLDEDVANNAQYQQYRELILDTALSYRGGEHAGGVRAGLAAGFFLDGLDAVFQAQGAAQASAAEHDDAAEAAIVNTGADNDAAALHPALGAMNNVSRALAEDFTSGLADFTADFNTPIFRPNEEQPSEISTMSLNIAQTTSVSASHDDDHRYTRINQQSEYDSRVSQHLGLAGDNIKHANLAKEEDGGQSYLYRTDFKSAMISRGLNFEDNKLLSVDELRRQQHLQDNKRVVQGKVESYTRDDLSSAAKNTAAYMEVAQHSTGQRLAQQFLNDQRSIEQLDNFIDGDKVDLFL